MLLSMNNFLDACAVVWVSLFPLLSLFRAVSFHPGIVESQMLHLRLEHPLARMQKWRQKWRADSQEFRHRLLPPFLFHLCLDFRLYRVISQGLHMDVRDLLSSPGLPLLLGFLDP